MPATVADARDLLVAAALCDDPVIYIDDRWLYDQKDTLPPIRKLDLAKEGPRCLVHGKDITLVASSYSTRLALDARARLEQHGVSAEVIDLRVINPLRDEAIVESVSRTGRVLAIDGGWRTCGMSAEVLAVVAEKVPPARLRQQRLRHHRRQRHRQLLPDRVLPFGRE